MRRKRYSTACIPFWKNAVIAFLDTGQVVGVYSVAPEARVLHVFGRRVAEHVGDIVADKGRRKFTSTLKL